MWNKINFQLILRTIFIYMIAHWINVTAYYVNSLPFWTSEIDCWGISCDPCFRVPRWNTLRSICCIRWRRIWTTDGWNCKQIQIVTLQLVQWNSVITKSIVNEHSDITNTWHSLMTLSGTISNMAQLLDQRSQTGISRTTCGLRR